MFYKPFDHHIDIAFAYALSYQQTNKENRAKYRGPSECWKSNAPASRIAHQLSVDIYNGLATWISQFDHSFMRSGWIQLKHEPCVFHCERCATLCSFASFRCRLNGISTKASSFTKSILIRNSNKNKKKIIIKLNAYYYYLLVILCRESLWTRRIDLAIYVCKVGKPDDMCEWERTCDRNLRSCVSWKKHTHKKSDKKLIQNKTKMRHIHHV